jgi:hypothetical protein
MYAATSRDGPRPTFFVLKHLLTPLLFSFSYNIVVIIGMFPPRDLLLI